MNLIKQGTMEYLVSGVISVPHCFTTRLGGVSTGHLASLNFGMHRGDSPDNVAENYRRQTQALGFSPEQLVLTRQTHSDIIRMVTADDRRGLDHSRYPECDGLITREPGVALMVFTADCTPILLHDPVTGAVGAVHAGWRGTAANIGGKAVQAMCDAFGARSENIRAAIGPNIAKCCFETDGDVPQAMLATFGEDVRPFIETRGNKFYLDLKAINALALQKAGVRCIEISDACTACDHTRFWSHRVTGGNRGSQGAMILCKER